MREPISPPEYPEDCTDSRGIVHYQSCSLWWKPENHPLAVGACGLCSCAIGYLRMPVELRAW